MSISGCGALELPNVNLFLFDVGGAKLFNQNNYHYGGGGGGLPLGWNQLL